KLTGYTIGRRAISSEGANFLPLAVMAQASITSTRHNQTVDPDTGDTVEVTPRNNSLVFSGGSLFLAGKVTDHLGGFIQWTYDNLATTADGSLGGHSALDNTDLRLVGSYSGAGAAEPDLIYGLTLHNNPTVQDVWNSTPAFGFPFTASPLASTPAAATLIDGGLEEQVAGLGGYVWWKKSLYAEVSLYRTADGAFSFMRAGQDIHTDGGVAALKGYNPYWRLAYNHEWGANSVMVGTYGLVADRYPSNFDTSTPTDRFRDIAVDAQYQNITDPHTFTAQATYIHEKQSYDASFPVTLETGAGIGAGPTPANATDTLRTFKAKATYYHDRKYGGSLGYFATFGSADAGLYGVDEDGNARKPDSNGYIVELDYLPIQYVRLMLQYTGYWKFDGASKNYDGNGRNARDNNTLFFDVWVAF
ncbi:MAG: cytochrome C, partial [Deltaproteobacteria bacterium]